MLAAPCGAQDAIDAADLRRTVEHLASDEMKGRGAGTVEARRAAEFVADRFKALGLKPGGSDGFFQRQAGLVNVLALREGSDPELTKEAIVIGAHYDGQGVRAGAVFNSADDNASGVAMLLEIAGAFAAADPAPRRTVLFQSYDAEENGFLGSLAFTGSDLFGQRRIVAMICFDLVGGQMMPWETNRIYALGGESSPQIEGLLARRVAEEKNVRVQPAGVYLIDQLGPQVLGSRSDYCAFRAKGVPYLFFSTGTPWYYHTPEDDPERLDYEKMQHAGRFVFRLAAEMVASDQKYEFVLGPTPRPADAATMADAMGKLLEQREKYGIGEDAAASMGEARGRLLEIAKKADVTKAERGEIQRAMVTLFTYARVRPK